MTPVLLGGGMILMWLFIRHARGHPAPVIDISLLRVSFFRHSLEAGTIMRTVASASGFIMPLWFQLGMGLNPGTAGAILVMPTTGVIFARIIGIPMSHVTHPRTLAIGGASALIVALTVQTTALSIAMMVINAPPTSTSRRNAWGRQRDCSRRSSS